MHIDGIQELNVVDGFLINLIPEINENNALDFEGFEIEFNLLYFYIFQS